MTSIQTVGQSAGGGDRSRDTATGGRAPAGAPRMPEPGAVPGAGAGPGERSGATVEMLSVSVRRRGTARA
jgi:hypothetical protein